MVLEAAMRHRLVSLVAGMLLLLIPCTAKLQGKRNTQHAVGH